VFLELEHSFFVIEYRYSMAVFKILYVNVKAIIVILLFLYFYFSKQSTFIDYFSRVN